MQNEKPKFAALQQIGHGAFSTVYKATWLNAPLSTHDDDEDTYGERLCASPTTLAGQQVVSSPQTSQQAAQPLDLIDLNGRTPINWSDGEKRQHKTTGNNNLVAATTGQKVVALKRVKFYEIQDSKSRNDCLREVQLLQQMRHPNIINYFTAFIERQELYIVLEFANGGKLSQLVTYFSRKRTFIPEETILKYFNQVCSAVEYIHSKRIIHRDIKPDNILMTSDGRVKLGDFGFGRFFSQNTRDAHSTVGTFYYMSPERFGRTGHSFSSDVWSLGCTLYELIALNTPFSLMNQDLREIEAHCTATSEASKQNRRPPLGQQAQQQNNLAHNDNAAGPENLQWLIEKISRAEYPRLDDYCQFSIRLRQLVDECLNPIPDERPNMQYICSVVNGIFKIVQHKQQRH